MAPPTCRAAFSIVVPSGTSISMPSIVIFAMILCCRQLTTGRQRFYFKMFRVFYLLGVLDMVFEVLPEMTNCTGHRPCSCVAERADGLAFDLLGNVVQQVDVVRPSFAMFDAVQYFFHPAGTFPAGATLTARFMVIKSSKVPEVAHNTGGFIHHDKTS